jgi:tRNA (cmo5U34)-methyltransferase
VSAAGHLGINLAEYDRRIRTFIPDYDAMLGVAASAVPAHSRLIVDLGIGTGALSARCLAMAPRARVLGVDLDAGMMAMAAKRLGTRATFLESSFLRAALPRCDAVVASFALHHVRTRPPKLALYRRVRRALRPGGRMILVDCEPARDRALAQAQRDAWLAHLERSYTRSQGRKYLAIWAREDVYVPIGAELELMRRAGFRAEVVWRRGAFAVLVGL